MVMAIADDLLGKDMIQNEMYSIIDVAETSEKKMRVMYKALRSGGPLIKSAFYTALQTNEPNLVKDLGKTNRYYLHPVITLTHSVHCDVQYTSYIFTFLFHFKLPPEDRPGLGWSSSAGQRAASSLTGCGTAAELLFS